MKVYKISHVATKTTKRGKRLTIKNYQNINGTDSLILTTQKTYVNLIPQDDNHRYNCLIESIKEIKTQPPRSHPGK